MVILNGLKYACETCIKGHRSSACSHTERTLFEIKKKGRPITQCERCRHLRKTKQVHVKCLCGTRSNNGDKNGARAKLKIPASATIRIDPSDPTHATITAGPGLLAPQASSSTATATLIKAKTIATKPKDAKSAGGTKSGNNTRPSSPFLPLLASVSHPPPPAAPTSSRNSNKSHPPRKGTPDSPTTSRASSSPSNEDKYTAASLLSDLSRAAIRSASAVTPLTTPYPHHHVQPFYNHNFNHNPNGSSYTWHGQSASTSGSVNFGSTRCSCSECYKNSVASTNPPMVLVSGEGCPYSCTTCTACNGYGFTSRMPGAVIIPSYPANNWRQQQPSSSTIVSTAPHIATAPAPAPLVSCSASVAGLDTLKSSTSASAPHHCSHNQNHDIGGESQVSERNGFAISGERRGCAGCMYALERSPSPHPSSSHAYGSVDDNHDDDYDHESEVEVESASVASASSAASPAMSVNDHDGSAVHVGRGGGFGYLPSKVVNVNANAGVGVGVDAKERLGPVPVPAPLRASMGTNTSMQCSPMATAPIQTHSSIELPKLIV